MDLILSDWQGKRNVLCKECRLPHFRRIGWALLERQKNPNLFIKDEELIAGFSGRSPYANAEVPYSGIPVLPK